MRNSHRLIFKKYKMRRKKLSRFLITNKLFYLKTKREDNLPETVITALIENYHIR